MGIFGWGRRRRGRTPRVVATEDAVNADDAVHADDAVDEAVVDEAVVDDATLDEAVRVALVPGFRTLGEVVDEVTRRVDVPPLLPAGAVVPHPTAEPDSRSERTSALRARVTARSDAAWRHVRAEQGAHAEQGRAAGATTGYARLVDAFRSLRADHGVMARMAVGLDVRAARVVVDRAHRDDPEPWAFVCFSLQDADALATVPAELLLTFGAFREDPSIDADLVRVAAASAQGAAAIRERSVRAAGAVILEALAESGLDATWEGETGQPIVVHVADWGKPLPG